MDHLLILYTRVFLQQIQCVGREETWNTSLVSLFQLTINKIRSKANQLIRENDKKSCLPDFFLDTRNNDEDMMMKQRLIGTWVSGSLRTFT